MKTIKFALGLAGLMLVPHFASAALVGPYTPDGHTLFLMHFDATGTSLITNVGSVGGNFITVTNTTSGNGLTYPPAVTTLLGHPSYNAGGVDFTNAFSATNTDGLADGLAGFDGNRDGTYEADVQGGPASLDAIAMTNLNIGVGAGNSRFTIEAIIQPTTLSVNQEILCSDDYNGSRGFQFRISAGQLEFNFISQGGSDFKATIPTSGQNAFVPGNWYHVAMTYDGTTLTFYWTKLDPTTTAANPIGSFAWTSTTSDGAVVAPLVVGNENRGASAEPFLGLIDELRVSSVARTPGGMEFTSPGVTIARQPLSQNIDNFMPVTFTVSTASADTNLFYQWNFDGNPIPNATNSSYSIASVQDTNQGLYDVVVTNSLGYSASSSNATLVVGAANFLAHRWSFTNDMTDSIGGADGTSNGTATVTGGALVLDGSSNCYMSLPRISLTNQNAITVEFWATFGTNGSYARVFDFGNTNFSGGVGILPPENYLYFTPNTGGGNQVLAIAPGNEQSQETLTAPGVLDGQTVHVTCVVDPPDGYMAIYTNAALEAIYTNLNVPLSSLNNDLNWVGRSLFTADAWLDGSIDELRIYNGALSAETIIQNNAAGPNKLPYDGPVVFAAQPSDTITVAGQPVTFTSQAIGHQAITYQWYENGSPIPGATSNDYSFIASSGQNGHTFYVTATNTIFGTNYSAVSSTATLTIVTPQPLTWVGANGSSWDPTTLNWSNATSLVAFQQYNEPVFNDVGLSQPNVDVTQGMYMVSLTANNSSGNYVIGSSTQGGSLNGEATLTKSGAGKLTMDLADNLSGGALISGGTLQIGNADGAGTLGAGDVTNNAILDFDRTNAVTVANPIHGSGTLQFDGTGAVALTGSNDYSGATLVNAGTVNVRNAASLGADTSGTTVASGARVYIDQNVNISEPLTLNGGMLQKGGAGVTTDYGAVTLGSASTLNVDGGATLDLTNSAGVSGGNALTLAGSGQGIIRGPLSLGANNLTVSGGTWMVAPNNSYSGGTAINGGALQITGAGSLGSGAITLGGGTLEATTNFTLASSSSQTITVSASSGIAVDSNATFTVANNLSGSGSVNLTKSGPGTLLLSGANSYQGFLYLDTASTSANDGRVEIANNGALANLLYGLPGTPSIFIRNNNAGTSTLALDGTSGAINLQPDISLAGRNNAVPAIDNVAGSNTISGSFELAVGGSYLLQSDAGTLNLTQPWPYSPPAGVTTTRTLILSGAGTITMSGGVQDGTIGSTNVPVAITKTGSGVVNLPAANTYSGSTIVSNGVLSLTGSISSTNGVFVDGGALAGNGIINDNVTVNDSTASGTIDALAVNGNFTINGPLAVDVNPTGLQGDEPTVSGGITNNGGSIVVNNLGAPLQVNERFVLFNKPVVNGASMTVTGGGAQWTNNLATDGSITVVSLVAATPTNITVKVTSNNLSLSWPPNYEGWTLETNAVGLTATNAWYPYPGSTALTNVSIPIGTNVNVFYRLKY